jgi:lysozyme
MDRRTVVRLALLLGVAPLAFAVAPQVKLDAAPVELVQPCQSDDAPCMPPAMAPGPQHNPLLDNKPYRQSVAAAALRRNLDPALVHAVILAESNYRADAISPVGAIGLMQVMPDTGMLYGVQAEDLHHPDKNLRAGTAFLADLLHMFGGNLELALAGYHAGPYAVIRNGGKVPNYSATRAYIPRVLGYYERLRPPVAGVVSAQLSPPTLLAKGDSKQP